jgi:predicted phosphohydrolase
MRIVCLSDTHNRHAAIRVPEGDLLLHAGDATMHGTPEEIRAFDAWLGTLPHPHKVVIAGNHDWLFQREPEAARALITNAVYLEDSGATIGGLRLWGSPWQPWFLDWAFNLRRGRPLREKWDRVPPETDVLVTHGPPFGIRDRVRKLFPGAIGLALGRGESVGCEELLEAVGRLRPRLHLFGHIHEGYGTEQRDGTAFVNASSCDARYRAVNAPIVIDL